MNKNFKNLFSIGIIVVALAIGFFVSCKKNSKNPNELKETVIQGTATMLVDETLQPIAEDNIAVFESQYPVKLTQINKSETEIINDLISQKNNIAILGRKLTTEESVIFANKKIIPRITPFAIDAIALVTSNVSKDTLIDLQEVINLLQSKPSKLKSLVFENPNSSTINYMNRVAGIKITAKNNIFSLKNNNAVLQYVIDNPGTIGVVGLNGIVQPTPYDQILLKKINVMAVRNVKTKPNSTEYYKPSQDNLGAGLYPLSREVYVLNYQGGQGLGMGFASFVAGEIGQRIILKSGLLPIRIPSRTINIRKGIYNNK